MATWGDLDGVRVLGIGPLSVDPAMQRRGVGAALMRELLGRIAGAGEKVVVLLGEPAYYGRFGFVAASDFDITGDEEWGEYFLAYLPEAGLGAGGDDDHPRGRYTYAAPFSLLG